MIINPLLLADFYKIGHPFQYPEGTTLVYSNLTPRKSRLPGVNKMVLFGLQYFIKEYLIKQFNEQFFDRPGSEVCKSYMECVEAGLGKNCISIDHIKALHRLGYLPIKIKAIPEGRSVAMGVPVLTIVNTLPEFYWITNFLETILSTSIWQACTSATIAKEYKKLFDQYAMETVGHTEGTQWQGHDFSMRGMSSLESACLSASAHLLSFTGTDTIPALKWLQQYYNADLQNELVGASVPATEHSVMCAGEKDCEIQTFRRLISGIYPKGIVSIVSDTWDLWAVIGKYAVVLKDEIMARDGKVVFRPDSGLPEDILCGDKCAPHGSPASLGVIPILYDIFPGTVNEKGYKVLDSHVGAIYGDSITLDRAREICERLKRMGYASTNWVAGIGSFTYQYNTRDTFSTAMKATYVEINGKGRQIFKNPVTDSGMKKSAKGLLKVSEKDNEYFLTDCVTWEEEAQSVLDVVFENGKLIKDFTLSELRKNILIG